MFVNTKGLQTCFWKGSWSMELRGLRRQGYEVWAEGGKGTGLDSLSQAETERPEVSPVGFSI